MSYPVSNSFATEPDASYFTDLGGLTHSYNSAQEAVDISSGGGQSLLRVNEPGSSNFWVELDLEVTADSSTRKHAGLWMTTGNGAEGYRFSHLDGGWSASRWSSGFGDGISVSSSVNDGTTLPSGGVVPTFNVGDRRVLRLDVSSGIKDPGTGLFGKRVMTFSVSGVMLFTVEELSYRVPLIPGVFGYQGIQLRLHSISGDTPSTTEQFPEYASAFSGQLTATKSVNNPLALLPGQHPKVSAPLKAGWKNIYQGGSGTIQGVVTIENIPGARQVRLFDKRSGLVIAETWSTPTGHYEFNNIDAGKEYFVVAHDHLRVYNAVVQDMLTP